MMAVLVPVELSGGLYNDILTKHVNVLRKLRVSFSEIVMFGGQGRGGGRGCCCVLRNNLTPRIIQRDSWP